MKEHFSERIPIRMKAVLKTNVAMKNWGAVELKQSAMCTLHPSFELGREPSRII